MSTKNNYNEISQKTDESHIDIVEKTKPSLKEFSISCEFLMQIIEKYQSRSFTEEIDFLETLKDDKFFEAGLATNFDEGISGENDDINRRRWEYSDNEYKQSNSKNFCRIIIESFYDPLLIILFIISFLCIWRDFIIDYNFHFSEGIAIFIINTIYYLVKIFFNYKNELKTRELNMYVYNSTKYSIIRGGQNNLLGQNSILTGDLIEIQEGMIIPVDGLLIEGLEILVDESSLTGETNPSKKKSLKKCIEERNLIIDQFGKSSGNIVSSPILLSGTKVLSGEGKFLALLVGDKCLMRKISLIIENEIETTSLQEKAQIITRKIQKIGLISSLLILLILFIRLIIERVNNNWDNTGNELLIEIIDYCLIAITVIIASVADGISISITLSLAFSVKKMLQDNLLVRNLKCCEILGSLETICTEKTGLLTQNRMTLKEIWNKKSILIDPYESNYKLSDYVPPEVQEIFTNSIVLNNSGTVSYGEEKGSATDVAFLKFTEKCGINNIEYKNQFQILINLPFTSRRKRNSLIYLEPKTSKRILLVKGASEIILEECSKFHSFDNTIVNIDDYLKEEIAQMISAMSLTALRTIVVAYKYLEENEDIETKDNNEIYNVEKNNLTFLSIFGIKDILRSEVPNAISICQNAGIKVRMTTGDNKLTGKAIAMECGIIDKNNENSLVIEGNEFLKITGGLITENHKEKIKNKNEFDRISTNLDVLARARPEDKYSLVVGLKEKYIVGVTGNGTNDIPSFKKADVSFVNGISGTESARDAADIILLDDNFYSIVKSVIWGRNIFDSINKCVQYQITVNVVAYLITLIGALILKQNIFQPIQILWVNFIINSLSIVVLAHETPSMEVMTKKPSQNIFFPKKILKSIIGQAIYQIIILSLLIFVGDRFLPEYPDSFDDEINRLDYPISYKYTIINGIKTNFVKSGRKQFFKNQPIDIYENILNEIGPSRHFTIIFNTFVLMQIFNMIHSRKFIDEINIFKYISKPMILVFSLMIFLQAIIVTYSGKIFSCYYWYNSSQLGSGLDIRQWLICIGFAVGGVIWGFFIKLIENNCFITRRRLNN